MAARFTIAHVTPYPLDGVQEVNTYVQGVASGLANRGHSVLVLAPSHSPAQVRQTRQALRAARKRPESLLEGLAQEGPRVLAVGEVLDVVGASRRPAASSRRRTGALSVDAARTLDELFGMLPLDFVHVHEPFAPSLSSAALRHSRALNVGSFHAPTERLLSTQVARRFMEGFFGRLDARTTSFNATARLMATRFPSEYRVVAPGCDEQPAGAAKRRGAGDPVQIVFVVREERAALRVFIRALRHLQSQSKDPSAVPWTADVLSAHRQASPAWGSLGQALRSRVRFHGFAECDESALLAEADVVVCASDGALSAPRLLLRSMAHGAVGVASRLPVYEEVLGEGQRGLLFESGDAHTLAAQLDRLITDASLRSRRSSAGRTYARQHTWERASRELDSLYRELAARRQRPRVNASVRRALAAKPVIDVDLHMHTDHSYDCATPVEVLLATARERGLGAIAVTDHNEISGALEAAKQAAAAGVKVIVGEEIKTAEQGEVIGLFIKRKIARGMTLAETVAEIKRQGGIVYVPHPFDRLHAVPDYEHLLPIVADVDAIETFNPRVAIDTFNEEAVRFAAKYNIAAGAGSDSHVPQGLGSVRLRMHDFDGPEQFLQSLREADIVTRPTSLLYVQALKFLQTKATPAPARRARSARRARRLGAQR
jgi:predicted metal-dependent phosphoesterase TrpH/glycosyltransferase involved in cell wall biosynthesis